MGQQRRHSQLGIGRQDAQHHIQLGGAFRVILHLGEQFPAHLVAHGVGDDDHGADIRLFYVPGIKVPLEGQKLQTVRFCQGRIPLGKLLCQIFVGVDVLHQLPQRLKPLGILDLVIVQIKLSVCLIQTAAGVLILLHDGRKPIRAGIGGGCGQRIGILQQKVSVSILASEVHLEPLPANLRNGKAVELSSRILRHETLREPLNQYPIHNPERVAVQQFLGGIVRKGLSGFQSRGCIVRQLIITLPVEDAVSHAV